MLYRIQYTHYKSNETFDFLGTELEFDNMTASKGGITITSKVLAIAQRDIEQHAQKAKNHLDNPFEPQSELAQKWLREFREYSDFCLQQQNHYMDI